MSKTSKFGTPLYHHSLSWKAKGFDEIVSELGHVVKFVIQNRRDEFLHKMQIQKRATKAIRTTLTAREKAQLSREL
jgi:hypothetical protein